MIQVKDNLIRFVHYFYSKMMAQNHVIVLIFFVIFSPGIAISGFPGFPDAFGLHEQNQTAFSQENVTTLEPLEFTTIPGEIKEPGAETIEETTGPSTATTIEEDDDLEMELGLIQLPPALSPNPTDNYFKLKNYTIKVEGQNGTLQEGIDSRNYRVSMDQDTVFLTSLGTLEIESTDQEGITETKLMPFNGLVNIDRVREDPKQNMTTYILNTGGLMVGDINMFDFGVDFDSVFLHGNLTLSPSEDDPDRLARILILEGSE